MSALLSLRSYGNDSDEDASPPPPIADVAGHLRPLPEIVASTSMAIVAAPDVVPNCSLDSRELVDPKTKELKFNPKLEDLYAPVVGPSNPFKTKQQLATKNVLAGFAEPAHVDHFQFESERRTFNSFGYAKDPSVAEDITTVGTVKQPRIVTASDESKDLATENKLASVFESTKVRPKDKRKREKNDDPGDVENYLGPWGKFVDEQRVACPTEEEKEYLAEYIAKKQRRNRKVEEKPMEEKSVLHLKEEKDYQGRSFMHPPQDVGVNLRSEEPPHKCFIPKRLIHTWEGHSKAVSAIRWFPRYAHLLLSCSMDTKIKLWQVYGNRKVVRTYMGHRQAVRDVSFNNDGTRFLSAGYDRYIKLWDTETGQCIEKFTNKKVPYCVKFNPDEDKQNLFVAGMSDKKIVCWDVRTPEDPVQEYDRHLGAVNTITFVDENRRFVSTSDDKSMRIWEWDIPVDMKYIADPSMHSMPAVTLSPNQKWLACQSMDNKIVIFSAINRFKFHRKKTFKGHMVAGYACGIDFSPEMSYLVSGDADGKVYVWDWKTSRMLTKWKAHDKVCISVLWHPHETSKLASAGWDGVIKFWD
ncbi:unnamed protein product [Notodromas monacha]|uniref:Pre-mRNA-processing factor 17 n=1 Tax=Notodromas monacha TaxID=399045 RepID=A0A7R9BWN3_9CRUS|nr:unnamed protein product [Notodromas monacha]CAG0923160.1 unnamed protein product [Notodromas monacha]